MNKFYFDCDHEAEYGCLRISCRKSRLSRQDALEIQYLFRSVWNDFPEFLNANLRSCFVRRRSVSIGD